MKIRVAIFKNESFDDHSLWLKACDIRNEEIDYRVIDITKADWLTNFMAEKFDLILLRPPGRTEKFKRLYDERSLILNNYSGIRIYPSLTEILIYENKRFLSDWLRANSIPSPETKVFYSKKEAFEFLERNKSYPIVAKANIGGSGNGVSFLHKKQMAINYVNKAFKHGVFTKTGPKLKKGSLLRKVIKGIKDRQFLIKRLSEYKDTIINPQKGFVIFQEFIPHKFEWRCVRIGDSYFAHKKIARNNKSSGTLIKGYDAVPLKLLDFIFDITTRTNLTSVAIDLFEKDEKYLVNEIQCYFGQSDPYQMLVDSRPGRYRRVKGEWIFEEGDFASNECYDLRLSHALSLLDNVKRESSFCM